MTSNIASKDVEAENQREIYLYPGHKSTSRVWIMEILWFSIGKQPIYPRKTHTLKQICRRRFERTQSRPFCFRSSTDLPSKRCDASYLRIYTTCTLDEKFYLHLFALTLLFLVHFMAEIRLYSHLANHIFFSQIFVLNFPNSKDKKFVVK